MDVIISNDLFIIKIRVFCGQQIFEVPLQDSAHLPTLVGISPSNVFEPVWVFHQRENLALLAITHYTFFLVMKSCDSVGRRLTVSSLPINHQM